MKKNTAILATGFVLLWNSGFIGAEYGLPYTQPFTLLFWRYSVLTAVVLLYLLMQGEFRWVGWKVAAPNMMVGILAHGVWLSCVLLALNRGVPAGIVALVVALQPLATGALSGRVVGEPTSLKKWAGLIIGFAGVVISVFPRIDFHDMESVFGYLIPLGSVIAITLAGLIQRRMEITRRIGRLPVDQALFYQALATTLILAVPAMYFEKLITEWEPVFIYTMGWLIFGVSFGAYALMWLLYQRMQATRVASLFYLGPPVTMVMAWVAFGDIPRMMDLVGMLVVVAGVCVTQWKSRSFRKY